jgi:Phage integrase family/CENP-B N-terminal DNA-binding domain
MGASVSKLSGVRALGKAHNRTCTHRGDHAKCDCPWRARYKGHYVALAKWADAKVDPRSRKAATLVLNRLVAAIDNRTFDPTGERRSLGTGQRLSDFITEWTTHYAEKHGLTSTGQPAMLKVLKTGRLGDLTLEHLAGSPVDIERWLDDMAARRTWKPRTWNHYHQLLYTLFDRATKWRLNGVARMERNPMVSIERRRAVKTVALQEVRLEEAVEDKLFAVVDQLNRPQHKPNRTQLTMEKADAIRARVSAGESQIQIAKVFHVAPSTVCAIVKGEVWNPAKYRVGTKGTEMRRRLMAAFDMGARAGEMLSIQIQHVQWQRPRQLTAPCGATFKGYEIVLPAAQTKGGKTTGEAESLFAGTLRLSRELEARRFALKNKPTAFLFGTEAGHQQKGFKRLWRELFTLAGLDFGRDKGLVWHTTRHEFISRIAERTGDPVLAQQLARHRDLKTTQGYFHTRHDRKWQAVEGLGR